jgi:hypothetical protein
VWFVNRCPFTGSITKVTRTSVEHFIVWEQSSVKHSFITGGTIQKVGRIGMVRITGIVSH